MFFFVPNTLQTMEPPWYFLISCHQVELAKIPFSVGKGLLLFLGRVWVFCVLQGNGMQMTF